MHLKQSYDLAVSAQRFDTNFECFDDLMTPDPLSEENFPAPTAFPFEADEGIIPPFSAGDDETK
jgi:hypothetical protein